MGAVASVMLAAAWPNDPRSAYRRMRRMISWVRGSLLWLGSVVGRARVGVRATAIIEITGIAPVRAAFESAAGHPRLVVLLDPL